MVELWDKLTVADEDPEFLDEYNRVIIDGSIPNGEDDNKIDGVNMELFYRDKMMKGLCTQ